MVNTKKDWEDKLKEFGEMEKKARENLDNVLKQIEELEVFTTVIKEKIETFK